MGIPERLQEERKRLRLTQEALAAEVGATKRSVINWEGASASPSAEVLERYAHAGANVLFIVTGQREPSQPDISADEQELLDLFRAAPLAVKAAAIGALQGGALQGGMSIAGNSAIQIGSVSGRARVKNR